MTTSPGTEAPEIERSRPYELSAAGITDLGLSADDRRKIGLAPSLDPQPGAVGPGEAFTVAPERADEIERSPLFKRSTRSRLGEIPELPVTRYSPGQQLDEDRADGVEPEPVSEPEPEPEPENPDGGDPLVVDTAGDGTSEQEQGR